MKQKVFCRAIGRDKNLYASIAEVKQDLEKIRKTPRQSFNKGYKPQRAYYCLMCSGWHLTHFLEEDNFASEQIRGIIYGDIVSDKPYLKDICQRKDDLRIVKELLYKEESEIIFALIDKGITNIDDIDRFLILIKRSKLICNLAVYHEEYIKYGKY